MSDDADRKYVQLNNPGPKVWGGLPPKKNWRSKTCIMRRDFEQLGTSIASISGKSERHMIDNVSSGVRRMKSGEHWSTNNTAGGGLWPTQINFFGKPYFGPKGCCPLKYLDALENDQGLLAHTPPLTRVPNNLRRWTFKNWLKIQRLHLGHVTLLEAEFQPPKLSPQSDVRPRAAWRWALSRISSSFVIFWNWLFTQPVSIGCISVRYVLS